ncbi:MAG: hypothetical protein U0269_08250 [Polyangiales bacterium]
MIDSLRTDSASRRSDFCAPSTRSSTPSTARSIATLALAAAVLAPSQSMADRPRASLPTVRVSAEAAEVSNGNPSYIRATILRSYAPLQQCGSLLPRGNSPLVLRSAVRLTIPLGSQPVTAAVQSTTSAAGANAPPFVAAIASFDACAQRSLMQLPWQRPPRGTTEARWTYTIQRESTQEPPPPPPTQYAASAAPAQVTNGNPSYIRATILRSYAPLQQCATQLPRTQNPTAVRVDVRLSIASDAAQPVSATLNTTRNSDAVFDASAFNTCAQNALRQLTWQRPPRGTTEASWSYTLQPQTTPAAR